VIGGRVSQYHDITVPVSPDTPSWPGDAAAVIEPSARIGAGSSCNLSRMCFGSHAGTHVDAPFHFLPDGKKLEEMPLDALIGPCWVAD